MAATAWQSPSPLIDDLLARGHEFSFDQVMRLARSVLGPDTAPELPESAWQERVRVRPDLSLAFPAADVARVKQDGAGLLIETTFLGLYGSSSPLPTHYTEDLLDEAGADCSVSRDFLDILHQRMYQLYLQCFNKYRLFNQVVEEQNPRDRERLFCLIGLGEKELREGLPDAWSLVRYAGLLSQFPRSASGLQTLLRDALGVHRVKVEQCVLRQVLIPVDQRMKLSLSGMCLGMNSILGSEMPDRSGKFRIHLGPLKKKEYDSFLPGTPRHEKLVRLIRLYITDPLDFDLKLVLAEREAEPIRLGESNGARLGWNSWCFAGDALDETSALFPLAHSAAQTTTTVAKASGCPTERKESSKLIDYYQQELAILRDLATGYAEVHPELSSMVSGHLADSGVERLFEGTAFLNANLRRKLDDDFPEIIHELTEALHPWDLRPIPATTIVAFSPKPELVQSLLISAGAEVASIPVQGTKCRFQTCFDVVVHPLTLLETSFSQPSGQAPSIRLQCELHGMGLSGWKVKTLRFFLGDDYPAACDMYLLLMRYLKRIVITSLDNGAAIELPADNLKPVGLADGESMLTKEPSLLPGHLLLQEYFLFHDKFLSIDLTGLGACRSLGGGSRFEIRFELTATPPVVPQVNDKSFILFATPVVNLFEHQAKSISFTTELQKQIIRPVGEQPSHYQLYSVDQVEGLAKKNSAKITYNVQNPLLRHTKDSHICNITRSKSPDGDGFDTFLSIPPLKNETNTSRTKLNIDLTCTNGTLPDQLNIGDVCTAINGTPESVNPMNITAVTAATFPENRQNRQWSLLSGFSLNSISLNGVDNFLAIIRLFILTNCRDLTFVEANKKRIDGIIEIEVLPTDRLMKGRMFRGYEVCLKLNGDHYTGSGDLYLFSSVLERFLGGYVTQNCFIRLVVEEIGKGYRLEWPARMGDRCVL
ncbi:type VI secretion system baseplate subunit TssF [Pelotalea chapellei]|uniref:Type VI secretion system baseplate subunit TssF n=1 Tax=Pelotalea chapellei TaxID=44671 RepID=A0ABS5UAS2_9BACT|nr:type VI secretion system baseplate subunit TssF [Pelotalea chapellei]MBT1072776.1 type VI secretion system baseplate subunit TssF [Pelotalea chapellei]